MRRVARPSPSWVSAPERRGVGGVVDQREQRRGDLLAHPVGERRPALEHRLAVERAGDDAEQGRRHPRLEHQGDRAAGGLDRAQQAGGALGRVVGGLGEVDVGGLAAHRHAVAGLGLVAVLGQRLHRQVADGRAPGHGDAGGGRHRPLARAVAPLRDAHADDARVAGLDGPLELERQVDLAVGGHRGQAVAPQVDVGRRHAVGLGQADPLLGLGEGGVVAGLGQHLGDDRLVERAGLGEALAPVVHDPHADAGRRGLGERLDLAAVHPHAGRRRAADEGLDLLAALRPRPRPWRPGRASSSARDGRRVAVTAPEIVTSAMTSVTPAALIGSQVRSLPTAVTSCSMRCSVEAIVNSRSGSASSPPRMRRPSAPVDRSPETGLTPECRPETSCTSTPSSTPAISSAAVAVPGRGRHGAAAGAWAST